ncbi:MAG: methyltransferase domain-containing protein [Treponema sp.]|jgi:2-polyprenyl-3-methyl-5-hydroxy-6-metoxy-1,4-benzoquinol methylase/spore coat polysaccharide biosynthesis predicted glycosyltransferase SpsG|nr:methyltransferase domain-containing protein [Treponema sp.]
MKTENQITCRIKKILFVPRIEKGKGGGHLIRSVKYVRELRQAGIDAFIFIEKKQGDDSLLHELSPLLTIDPMWIISSCPEKDDWSFIVLDNFQSSKDEYVFWTKRAPVIAIDEGGPQRDSFDFLLDILPGLSGRSKANISHPSFLPLPKNRRPQFPDYLDDATPFKILSVFGAEDACNMGLLLAKNLASIPNSIIDVVRKDSLPDENALPANINVIKPFPGLRETLHQYDVIVTHYGLTAFEAIHARVPVILASPTKYHEKLAKDVGFVSLGTKDQAIKKLKHCKTLHEALDIKNIIAASIKIARDQELDAEPQSFIDFIKTIDCDVSGKCPVCGDSSLNHSVIARFADRTYRRCKQCSVEYMLRLRPPSIRYTEDYFFSDYKKQYGKTYLEDFPHLVDMAQSRLSHIKKLMKKNHCAEPIRVLDIGCAYGPFLQAAKNEGFETYGIDPSADAVTYVTDTLGILAQQGFFPNIDFPQDVLKDGFDVISLWYVIEHFENAQAALEKISAWLKPGGVLAFSTPSGMGISARRNRRLFLEKSPADHWTIWHPRQTKNTLKLYHFTLKQIVVTGHHPERFPFVHKKGGFVYDLLRCISRYFGLGDTFEAYAVKK